MDGALAAEAEEAMVVATEVAMEVAMEVVVLWSFRPARVGHRPVVGARAFLADQDGTREVPVGIREVPAGIREVLDGTREVPAGILEDPDGTKGDLVGAKEAREA